MQSLPILICCVCAAPLPASQGTPLPGLHGPACRDCLRRASADTANTLRVGEPDGGPSFSLEFEVCGCRCEAPEELSEALSLLRYGFLRTHDGTVEEEYKSPIYQSLTAFEEVLETLDTLEPLVDTCCGTHVHVACAHNVTVFLSHDEVFGPLMQHLFAREHLAQTHSFWGRTGYYEEAFRSWTRYDTVEFRLPRFQCAPQYRAVVAFCRQAGALLYRHLEEAPTEGAFFRRAKRVGEELLTLYHTHVAENQGSPATRGHK